MSATGKFVGQHLKLIPASSLILPESQSKYKRCVLASYLKFVLHRLIVTSMTGPLSSRKNQLGSSCRCRQRRWYIINI
eukprot:9096232-Karenia_brevis.AAC.1